MSETSDFDCPSCGAALSPRGNAAQIQCAFCGTAVIVPADLRDSSIVVSPATTRWVKVGIWGFVILIGLTFVLPFVCSMCALLAGLAGSVLPFFVK